ncbi:hypothetical protein [Acinetobacter wuhouensis]|uniref:RND transporter n=1 Tax=Acinetobacter wuhouensis TaxID=1879050 RepID=A0A4Q7AJ10_9GAMM|nr:hypothetical protein [Acinetobacter wuhouensis]RZG46129.1 hypothetical protein EXU28_10170 [Acinetobacter wuhouensis]RZG71481.1 hypothetical protein EXU29_13715 [Acinetobacter wuhouensis]
MVNLKQVLYLFLASIMFSSPTLHAKPIYISCDAQQSLQLIQKFHLLSDLTVKYEEIENRSDCIQLNDSQVLIATANMIDAKQDNYQINLDLIDIHKHRLLMRYQHPQFVSEANGRFSSIKFDRVPYSNLAEQYVIGLKTHLYNIGEHSYDLDKFNLFRIIYSTSTAKNNKIQWVLKSLNTQIQSSWRPMYDCDESTSDEIKSIFILKNNQNHQLEDILLKQTKKSVDTDEKCKTKRVNQTQQQLLKFNGESYQIDRTQLLYSDDLKDE